MASQLRFLRLLGHLIGSRQHVRRDRHADLLGGFQIDHQLELLRLLDGKISGLPAFQNLVYISRGAARQVEDHNVRFYLLHKKRGSRVRNQLFCPVCKVVIERDETVRGYEVTKVQYVRVEDTELEALEAEANSSIDMREFIPIEKVDPIYFESTYYLAPDKGADKPYRLLAETMAKTGRVALAQTVFHNKESLVLIRSVKRGLVLHFLFFKNEICDFDAIAKGEDIKLPSEQLELGRGLIEKMSSADFEPERYTDEYRERALAMIEKKVEGQEIKAVAPAPRRTGQVVDIFAALKKSLETAGQPQRATTEQGKRKRKA